MRIREWSDTQLKFHITERTSNWEINEVDLTEYDKILLEIRYVTGKVEYEWKIDEEWNSYVIFDIFSEATEWKAGRMKADVWWVKGVKKHRFNRMTIDWEVLPSVKVPEWTVSD